MIQSIWKKKLILVVLALCVTCFCMGCGQQKAQEPADQTQTEISQETEAEQTEAAIDRDGSYDSKDEVALYLYTYGELPGNYMTKKEARSLGWDGGKLEPYAPGMCIGGDYYGNYEGLLPEDEYHECDIDTLGKKRGPKRLVYSDENIYYTEDHYETFEQLYDKDGEL